jgi:hypothetical protein
MDLFKRFVLLAGMPERDDAARAGSPSLWADSLHQMQQRRAEGRSGGLRRASVDLGRPAHGFAPLALGAGWHREHPEGLHRLEPGENPQQSFGEAGERRRRRRSMCTEYKVRRVHKPSCMACHGDACRTRWPVSACGNHAQCLLACGGGTTAQGHSVSVSASLTALPSQLGLVKLPALRGGSGMQACVVSVLEVLGMGAREELGAARPPLLTHLPPLPSRGPPAPPRPPPSPFLPHPAHLGGAPVQKGGRGSGGPARAAAHSCPVPRAAAPAAATAGEQYELDWLHGMYGIVVLDEVSDDGDGGGGDGARRDRGVEVRREGGGGREGLT